MKSQINADIPAGMTKTDYLLRLIDEVNELVRGMHECIGITSYVAVHEKLEIMKLIIGGRKEISPLFDK